MNNITLNTNDCQKTTENKTRLKLYFDEPTHSYTDSFGNKYTSTTTLLHKYQEEFKKDYWATIKANEAGVSKQAIEDRWANITKESCDRGNLTHNYLEAGIKLVSMFKSAIRPLNKDTNELVTMYDISDINSRIKPMDIKDFIESTNNKYPDIYKIFQWYIERDYKIYSEIGVFLEDALISGLVDVPVIREDKFVVLDWKTNKDGVKFKSGYYKKDKSSEPHQLTNVWVDKKECLLPPISNLPNCNGSIYNMQLSMYAYMMEKMLNIPCSGIALCHIGFPFIKNKYGMPYKDENGLYTIEDGKPETITWHKMKYLKNECELIVQAQKSIVKANNSRNTQYNIF